MCAYDPQVGCIENEKEMFWEHIFFFFFFRYCAGQRFIAALSHNFRVGGGVHDSYTFQCGLVGSFTSPGIDTR